jgi:H+/Cl- antiporter ClcA
MAAPIPAQIPFTQQLISVLWPSFICAIVASGVFFSAFNPLDLIPFNLDLDFSPLAAYSIGFFLFWILGILSSYGTLYFTISNCRFLGRQRN